MFFWICVFILMSAFFSGMETGFVSLSPLKIEVIGRKNPSLAKKIKQLRADWNLFLSTTLIGNDLAVVSASSLFTVFMNNRFHIYNEAIITLIFTVILLLFGESGPKIFCRYYNERMVGICLPVFMVFERLFYPASLLFNRMIRSFFDLLGVSDRADVDRKVFVTREELRMLLYQGSTAAHLPREERTLIKRIFDFSSKKAKDIVTPMDSVASVDSTYSRADILHLARETGFSRFPVKEGGKIIGFVHILDLLFMNVDENWHNYIRPVLYIYAEAPVGQVFYQMQSVRANMVVIYGDDFSPIGIITMKDIMDEITGEVMS